MSAIAGLVAVDPRRNVEAGVVEAMLARLRRRGPHEGGLHVEEGVALGHRPGRTADPADDPQPTRGGSAGTRLVADGTVYNAGKLRDDLERRGHVFRTASDAEVAAHAYDAWDLTFLDRLEGAYALALWDGTRRRLVLVRDRMGQKPLFYGIFDGLLLFASELRALLGHPAVPRELDPRVLSRYLCLGYVPAPESLVEGIRKLEPGSALVVEAGEVRHVDYWAPPLVRVDEAHEGGPEPPAPATTGPAPGTEGWTALDHGEAVERLRELLDAAVGSAIAPEGIATGVLLPGGLASATVAALAARHGLRDTFSLASAEPGPEEGASARVLAADLGTDHHEWVVEAGEMEALVAGLGATLDEPLADPSLVSDLLLSRAAREKVAALLTPHGSDELFAGRAVHRAHRLAPLARALPDPLHAASRALARRLPSPGEESVIRSRILRFLRGARERAPMNHVLWTSIFPPHAQAELLTPGLLEEVDLRSAVLGPAEAAWAASAGAPTLLRAMHLDARTRLPDSVLAAADRAGTAAGLELRAPLLHRDVAGLVFGLPGSHHMWGLRGGRLLHDAARGLLPEGVVELAEATEARPPPVGAWLRDPLASLAGDVLGTDAVRSAGLFRADEVARLLREHRGGRADHGRALWALLAFELWRRDALART